MSMVVKSNRVYSFLAEKLLNEHIDFIAFIVSPFHALGVDAFVFELYKKDNRYPRGIVFVYPHPKNGIIVDKTHLRCNDFAIVELVYIQEPETSNKRSFFQLAKEGIKMIKGFLRVATTRKNASRKNLFVISVMDIPILFFKIFGNKEITQRYSPNFVIIDEGVGSYMNKDVWKLVNRYDKGAHSNKDAETFTSTLTKVSISIIKKFAKYCVQTENRLILAKEEDTLIPNMTAISSYRRVIVHKEKGIPKWLIPITRKSWVIIATQPFVEYNQVDTHNYVSLLDEIIEILEDEGFNVILKPHPRESFTKYKKLLKKHRDLVVFPQSVVLEDILQLRPPMILGFTSTSLITSKLFYEIPSISMVDILIQSSDDPLLNISAKQFKERFQNIVWFVESIESLEDMVRGFK